MFANKQKQAEFRFLEYRLFLADQG